MIVEGKTRAFAHRTRTDDRETQDGSTERWVEYGVGAWADSRACELLMAAIARNAADCDADRTRVLIPETVETVSDATLAGHRVSDHPDFVLAADLTREFDVP